MWQDLQCCTTLFFNPGQKKRRNIRSYILLMPRWAARRLLWAKSEDLIYIFSWRDDLCDDSPVITSWCITWWPFPHQHAIVFKVHVTPNRVPFQKLQSQRDEKWINRSSAQQQADHMHFKTPSYFLAPSLLCSRIGRRMDDGGPQRPGPVLRSSPRSMPRSSLFLFGP